MVSDTPLLFVPIGSNPARPFGMDARDRACLLATNAGFECADVVQPGRAALLASMAYGWDPVWLKEMRNRPRTMLTLGGKPVLAHVPEGENASVAGAIENGSPVDGYEAIAAETAELTNTALRKRERPFVLPLDPNNSEPVERAAYDAAYKGVTDVLTLYLWRKPAFHLTRWSARAGLTPNMVTFVGGVLCLLAFILFWRGEYWWAWRPASASWCSTRSTGSLRAAQALRPNGEMCSTMASTWSTRPFGGGRGSMDWRLTASRSNRSMRLWFCG